MQPVFGFGPFLAAKPAKELGKGRKPGVVVLRLHGETVLPTETAEKSATSADSTRRPPFAPANGRVPLTVMQDANDDSKGPRTTKASVIVDGDLVEMAFDPKEMETFFLRSAPGGTSAQRARSIEDSGERVVPFSPRNNLLTHRVVLFPSACGEFTTAAQLLAEVRSFIHRYVDLTDDFEEIAAQYVLFSWRYDEFSDVPYVRVRGDFGSGKSRFLLTVGSLVYKPIFASGASTVSPLFRILDAVQGTLIIDEADFRFSDERAEIVKILNNGNARGFPVLRSEARPGKEFDPRAFHVYGPKLIATRRTFDDPALESRCITEELGGRQLRGDIPLNLPDFFHDEARQLRNKLLAYRFRTWGGAAESTETDRRLEPRVAQVFGPLLATIEDAEARARLIARARTQSEILRHDRTARVEGLVLEAIASLVREKSALTIRAVAERFGREFSADFGEAVTPRWIGGVIRKRLGVVPEKRHGVFVIAPSAFERLQYLFKRFGVGDIGDVGDVISEDQHQDAA